MKHYQQTRWLLAVLLMALATHANATLPIPDHVIYGEIYINAVPVTVNDTQVVIEIRRVANGPAISSYRYGDNPNLGDRYAIDVQLEQADPNSIVEPGVGNANASLTGDALFIVVLEDGVVRHQTNFVAAVSSEVSRLDFGSLTELDRWQQEHFGAIGLDMDSDPTGKGQSLMDDYIAGTDPNDVNSLLTLNIGQHGMGVTLNDIILDFFTIRAGGVGYTGLDRYYALEYSTNVGGTWMNVPSFTNLFGDNQPILYLEPNPETNRIYRARVWLQPHSP